MGGDLRVLCVNPGLHLGGAEQSLLLLLDGLRARGLEATVALFGPGSFHDRLRAAGIPTVTLRSPRALRRVSRYRAPRGLLHQAALAGFSLAAAVDLARAGRRTRVDLIHTNGLKAHLIGGIAGRLIGVPVIWHVRDFPPPGSAGRVLRRAARTLPALVLANSDAVASAVGSAGRAPVVRVYNPVDLQRFRPDLARTGVRHELGLSDDVPVVGLVAHLTPWKGHDLFLSIARAVADRVPTCRFVVAGGSIYETDGHNGYQQALTRQAEALGLQKQLAFLGIRHDVPDVMAALDILVHCPTSPEPFGRSIAEAMAVGRPVVAARCGGIPEIVDDGMTGFMVSPGDVDGFTSAIVRLLGDPAKRREFGIAGRRRIEASFSVDEHTRRVVEAYATVLRGPR